MTSNIKSSDPSHQRTSIRNKIAELNDESITGLPSSHYSSTIFNILVNYELGLAPTIFKSTRGQHRDTLSLRSLSPETSD